MTGGQGTHALCQDRMRRSGDNLGDQSQCGRYGRRERRATRSSCNTGLLTLSSKGYATAFQDTVIDRFSLGALDTASVAEWLGARDSVETASALLALLSVALLVGRRRLREAG